VALSTLATFVAFGAFVFIAQYLQLVLGLSPLQAGLWTVPFAGGFILGSMLTPMIVRRVRPAIVMSAGSALAAIGFGMITQVEGTSALAVLVSGFVVFSLGLAPVFTLATDMIVATAPPERAGAASAISETGSELGGALGIAILGSIGIAVYRNKMTDAIPAGLPSEAAEAARDTLGGAMTVAGQLPDQLGAKLLSTAREAFTQSLELTAATSAAVAVGIAILAIILLRRVEAHSELQQ
jgi:DHA2 family multidrug resistance protein-like MFS transporter